MHTNATRRLRLPTLLLAAVVGSPCWVLAEEAVEPEQPPEAEAGAVIIAKTASVAMEAFRLVR